MATNQETWALHDRLNHVLVLHSGTLRHEESEQPGPASSAPINGQSGGAPGGGLPDNQSGGQSRGGSRRGHRGGRRRRRHGRGKNPGGNEPETPSDGRPNDASGPSAGLKSNGQVGDVSSHDEQPGDHEPTHEPTVLEWGIPQQPGEGENYRATAFDCSGFKVGDCAPEGVKFVIWKALDTCSTRWSTYKGLSAWIDRRASIFSWTFFYLHNPKTSTVAPYLLVPSQDADNFLAYLKSGGNSQFSETWPDCTHFECTFTLKGALRPRFLGKIEDGGIKVPMLETSTERSALRTLVRSAPPCLADFEKAYRLPDSSDKLEIDAFFSSIETCHCSMLSFKAERRAHLRSKFLTDKVGQLQRWLGSHPETETVTPDPNVVFVSLDIEAIETNNDLVSEIGIVILDMRDVVARLGQDLHSHKNWVVSLARAHHLRVAEYATMRNHKYVKGCPSKFKFGKSTFPPRVKIPKAIDAIMRPYMSADNPRTIVLVGHDVRQDLNHLHKVEVDFWNKYGFAHTADTQPTHQHMSGKLNGASLQNVLRELDIEFSHLHNAGNDAFYTLLALVELGFRKIAD